jgi:hypothetical protein
MTIICKKLLNTKEKKMILISLKIEVSIPLQNMHTGNFRIMSLFFLVAANQLPPVSEQNYRNVNLNNGW